ncbi:hypothetical protein C8A01DRAFT_21391 [Parachaetomium inaequale]|uniref:NACHT-NTPase and P-loop NTPases N-terminal domain-containing protein n=1 Tax=Parachaetomium inaequale TaxID=2588326 RepID=A0AAN6P7X0_9PEZI|nr:hypothetical protein C8A01DRAFT_21391 [Parachaetomium inaequale]
MVQIAAGANRCRGAIFYPKKVTNVNPFTVLDDEDSNHTHIQSHNRCLSAGSLKKRIPFVCSCSLPPLILAYQSLSTDMLPLVEQTLREAKAPAKKVKSTDDSNMLGTRLDNCEEKADDLLEIFQKIARKSTQEYVPSVYRSIAVKLGKYRAETLMGGMVEDLLALVAHHVFQAVMQKQVEPLEKARHELANVSPSLSESDLDEQAGTASQHGDGNRQFNNFGTGTQKNVDGSYFEAKGDQNFGMVPPKESMGKKET